MRRALSHRGLAIALSCDRAPGAAKKGRSRSTRCRSRASRRSTESRLRGALATRQSSQAALGTQGLTSTAARFDADLKRIQAFYADRGYPDARVTGFDVKLNDKQDAVDITRDDRRRRAGHRRGGRLRGLRRSFRPTTSTRCSKRMPLKVGEPRDRAARRDDARDGAQRAAGSRLSRTRRSRRTRRPRRDAEAGRR